MPPAPAPAPATPVPVPGPAPGAQQDEGVLKYVIAAAVLGACVGNMFVARKMRSISKMKVPTGESVIGQTRVASGSSSTQQRVDANRARRQEEERARQSQRFKEYNYQREQQEQVKDAYQAWARGKGARPPPGHGSTQLLATMSSSLRTLGLPENQLPSKKEVKDAFAKLAWELHPDKVDAADPRRQALQLKFGQASDAYKVLLGQVQALESPTSSGV